MITEVEIRAVYSKAREYVESLQIGVVFMGSMPAALAYGYTRDTAEYSLFIAMAGMMLGDGAVYTDNENRITRTPVTQLGRFAKLAGEVI